MKAAPRAENDNVGNASGKPTTRKELLKGARAVLAEFSSEEIRLGTPGRD